MTVGELVGKLKDCPQDMEVIYCTYAMEWFDRLAALVGGCIEVPDGVVNSVKVDEDVNVVWLKEEQA